MKNMKQFICAGLAACTIFSMSTATVFADEVDEYYDEPSYEEPAPMVGMPNPMIEYKDVPELEKAIGFPVMYLPSNLYSLYHPAVHVFAISGQVADLRFENKADGTKITLRSALKERVLTDDISGCYGFAWHKQSAGDVKRTKVDVGIPAEGERVAKWEAGRFVFSLYVTGVDDDSFAPLLKNFVAVSNRFSYKYRNFTLNPYADINKADNKAPAPAANDTAATDATATTETTAAAEAK